MGMLLPKLKSLDASAKFHFPTYLTSKEETEVMSCITNEILTDASLRSPPPPQRWKLYKTESTFQYLSSPLASPSGSESRSIDMDSDALIESLVNGDWTPDAFSANAMATASAIASMPPLVNTSQKSAMPALSEDFDDDDDEDFNATDDEEQPAGSSDDDIAFDSDNDEPDSDDSSSKRSSTDQTSNDPKRRKQQ
eukprot:TRINITY_DN7217_c0_g1_i2.p1 TRINITY_DN7217_c0_g1~~TRINITY_DN7217_c0_g1_i2.p1  ORF type:complete len:195 (-),score=46.17 TRINITY_DN7217_c0_g1_i2:262-846(-)